jgi:large repetitive protein
VTMWSHCLLVAHLFAKAPEPVWVPTGSMTMPRVFHVAVLLRSGQVLVVGSNDPEATLASAELYDPVTGTWRPTGTMVSIRYAAVSTLLPSGEVLLLGGRDGTDAHSAELYNPETGVWRPASPMTQATSVSTVTLLPSGEVLVTGQASTGPTTQLYNPTTDTWRETGQQPMSTRFSTATLLISGKVLLTGTRGDDTLAELYDFQTDSWHLTAVQAPAVTVAVRLHSGAVLGINNYSGFTALYDPLSHDWYPVGEIGYSETPTLTLLPTGNVLVIRPWDSPKLYIASSRSWVAAPHLNSNRVYQTVTVLLSQEVLVAGGGLNKFPASAYPLASAELYRPRPVSRPLAPVTPEDTPVNLTLEATDADGDALSFTVLSSTTHGTLSGAPPQLSYTPAPDFHGTDAFTYTVSDGTLESLPATVSITVAPVNDEPRAEPLAVTTLQDTAITLEPAAQDADGDALTFHIVQAPSHGSLLGKGPRFTFIPSPGYGEDRFTYKVNDGRLDSNVVAVSVTVLQQPGCGGCHTASGAEAAAWGTVWMLLVRRRFKRNISTSARPC